MPTTPTTPHLLRNAVLAGVVVAATSATVVLIGDSGARGVASCPSGQEWVIAEPVPAQPAAAHPAGLPGRARATPSAMPPPLPAGCVDPALLPATPAPVTPLPAPTVPVPTVPRPAVDDRG